jgi:hypothetical protein
VLYWSAFTLNQDFARRLRVHYIHTPTQKAQYLARAREVSRRWNSNLRLEFATGKKCTSLRAQKLSSLSFTDEDLSTLMELMSWVRVNQSKPLKSFGLFSLLHIRLARVGKCHLSVKIGHANIKASSILSSAVACSNASQCTSTSRITHHQTCPFLSSSFFVTSSFGV